MDALIDDNGVKTALGVWCVDGKTLITIKIKQSNNGMLLDTTSTISYTPIPVAPRSNHPALLFTGTDGLSYPVNVNANGAVLVSY